jgi:hypothetical protein
MTYNTLADALNGVSGYCDMIVRIENCTNPERPFSNYTIFSDPFSLLNEIEEAGKGISFHEITRIETDPFALNQRLYFDIDIPSANWGNLDGRTVEKNVIEHVALGVKTWLSEHSLPQDMAISLVASSSDYITKISLHILYPKMEFKSHFALKRMAMEAKSLVPPWVSAAIDTLYKKNQGLRLLWARKAGTSRIKKPFSGPWPTSSEEDYKLTTLAISTIHPYGSARSCEVLDEHVPVLKIGSLISAEAAPEITNALAALEELEREGALVNGAPVPPIGGSYIEKGSERKSNGTITIKLVRRSGVPSFCVVCKRTHEHENPYIILKPNGHYLLYCHRNDGKKPQPHVHIYTDINMSHHRSKELDEIRSSKREITELENVTVTTIKDEIVVAFTDNNQSSRFTIDDEDFNPFANQVHTAKTTVSFDEEDYEIPDGKMPVRSW